MFYRAYVISGNCLFVYKLKRYQEVVSHYWLNIHWILGGIMCPFITLMLEVGYFGDGAIEETLSTRPDKIWPNPITWSDLNRPVLMNDLTHIIDDPTWLKLFYKWVDLAKPDYIWVHLTDSIIATSIWNRSNYIRSAPI